jgi:hypothetical protein
LSYTHIDKTHAEHHSAAMLAPAAEPLAKGRAWRGWLWILLLVGIIAGVWTSLAHAADPGINPNSTTPSLAQPGTEQRPFVVDTTEGAIRREEEVQAEHTRNERVTTWSTVILAVFTAALWAANIWLIIDAKRVSTHQEKNTQAMLKEQARSADAMRDVADATENNATLMSGMFAKQMRAYLTVEIGGATYQDAHLRFEANPVLTNNGLTPARNVCFRVMADILEGINGPESPKIEDLIVNDMSLAPRQQVTLARVVANRIPDGEVADVMAGITRRLHAWGRVTYDDVYGGHWETKFYFTYFFPKAADGYLVRGVFSISHNCAS